MFTAWVVSEVEKQLPGGMLYFLVLAGVSFSDPREMVAVML
jgi:hypothetical protein